MNRRTAQLAKLNNDIVSLCRRARITPNEALDMFVSASVSAAGVAVSERGEAPTAMAIRGRIVQHVDFVLGVVDEGQLASMDEIGTERLAGQAKAEA